VAEPDTAPLEDVTEYARLFLECAQQTQEMFGASHLIDVLRGSRSQRVLQWQHDRLDCHGSGRSLSKVVWQELAAQFRQQQFVALTDHQGLMLTERGRAVLAGATVQGRLALPQGDAPLPRAATSVTGDPELFEQLRALRKELADQERIPPYMVFSDRSLDEMATYYPQSEQSFAEIHGVGRYKLEQYAEVFVAMIQEYCGRRGIAERHRETQITSRPSPSGRSWRIEQAVAELHNGKTLQEIAQCVGVTDKQVLKYFEEYVSNSHTLPYTRLLALSGLGRSQQAEVFGLFDQMGTKPLKPIHETLGERVTYNALRLLRLCHLLHRESVERSE
jgi:ATP-dependent DNA helicase RecQ